MRAYAEGKIESTGGVFHNNNPIFGRKNRLP